MLPQVMEHDDLAAMVRLMLYDVAENPARGVFVRFVYSVLECVGRGPRFDAFQRADAVAVVQRVVPGKRLGWWVGPKASVDVYVPPHERLYVRDGNRPVEDELLE